MHIYTYIPRIHMCVIQTEECGTSHKYIKIVKFSANYQENFQTNSAVHSINTTNKYHTSKPTANHSHFHTSV